MIIKGKSRGRSTQLARHLLNAGENEDIRLYECRGTVAQHPEGALAEMEAQGKLGRSKHPLYHASISPDPGQPMTDKQFAVAVDLLEAKLGFAGQPRIIIFHRKLGREHAHVVWSRIDRSGKAISDSWNYARHEEAARELERRFGHAQVEGAHVRASDSPRPQRTPKEYDLRQAARSGIDPKMIRDELAATWVANATGAAFKQAIEAAGYRLVRGDRRGYVVLDRRGEAHSLARCLGIRSRELLPKLDSVPLQELPTVAAARSLQRKTVTVRSFEMIVATFGLQTGPMLRRIHMPARLPGRFAAEHVAIIKSFAAKIAAACETGSHAEIAARIRRLREEEAATIEALKRASRGPPPTTGLRQGFRLAARQVGRRPVRRGPATRSRDLEPMKSRF